MMPSFAPQIFELVVLRPKNVVDERGSEAMEPIGWFRALGAPRPEGGDEAREDEAILVEWPNLFHPSVHARFGDERVESVHMPWQDRFVGFGEFLTRCSSVARLRVRLRAGAIHTYILEADATAIDEQMRVRGYVDGEPFLVALLRERSDVMVLPCDSGGPDVFRSALRRSHEGPPHAWAEEVESLIQVRENTLLHSTCVPLGASGWAYDCTSQRLVRWEDTAWLKVRFRGGVLPGAVAARQVLHRLVRERGGPTLLLARSADEAAAWATEARTAEVGMVTQILNGKEPLSPTDLAQSRLVVAPCALLRSRGCAEAIDALVVGFFGPGAEKQQRAALHAIARFERDLPMAAPALQVLRWGRIVVDHVEEYFGEAPASRERRRCIDMLDADVWWGVSESIECAHPFFLQPKLCDDGRRSADESRHPCLRAALRTLLLGGGSSSTHHPKKKGLVNGRSPSHFQLAP